ncbi:hypothetical protein Ac2012v2_006633 [Leucoagaricus gongylophorus]
MITLLSILLIMSAFQKDAPDAPVSLPGLSLSHIIPFYKRRFDFLSWGIHATRQSVFQFKLLRNTVIVVSGESGRQVFFSAKGLDLTEGFKILSGAIPSVSGITTDLQSGRIATIHKRVAAAQREGHLSLLLPHLLEDSRKVMERWGTSGRFDPFEKIYDLTFQTTIRALSCGEIADDHDLVSRIKKLYDKLDAGTTPVTILVPWLPSWTMVNKLWSTKKIYDIIVKAVKQRQALLMKIEEGEKPQDTMQLLLDAGDDRMAVVGFIMGLLIAGARATGTSASWLITFLASHPEWARKARAEVEDLVATHTNVRFPSSQITPLSPVSWPSSSPTPTTTPPLPSISDALNQIPLSSWEDPSCTRILDALIKETLRVAQPHTAMRRNVGPEFYIDGKRIETGDYVVYPFSDVHLDEEIYENAAAWMPERWLNPSDDEKDTFVMPGRGTPFGYVGWGGGMFHFLIRDCA